MDFREISRNSGKILAKFRKNLEKSRKNSKNCEKNDEKFAKIDIYVGYCSNLVLMRPTGQGFWNDWSEHAAFYSVFDLKRCKLCVFLSECVYRRFKLLVGKRTLAPARVYRP